MTNDSRNTETRNDGLIDFIAPVNDTSKNIIKVIGVGGGGCNAVGSMYNEKMDSVTYAVTNTDSKSLSSNPVPVKLMLGTDGLGAGAKPEEGREQAEKSIEDIKRLFSDSTKMVFVVATMGGGTGTGAAPVVARVAREMGLLTIGIVTLPFYFEKRPKILKSLKGVEEMRKNVDALLIINNEQLTKVYNTTRISINAAFGKADEVMANAVKSISELITLDGKIQTDFRDVETTMRNGKGAIMAIGRASGENRVENAILNALKSPLLYGNDISKAKRVLMNIYTSSQAELYVHEMQEIDAFMEELGDVEFIWGISTDETLDEDVKITILATDIDNTLPMTVKKEETQSEDEIIDRLYGKSRRKKRKSNILSKTKEQEEDGLEEEGPTEDPSETETIVTEIPETETAVTNIAETETVVAGQPMEEQPAEVQPSANDDAEKQPETAGITPGQIVDLSEDDDDDVKNEPSHSFLTRVMNRMMKMVQDTLEE